MLFGWFIITKIVLAIEQLREGLSRFFHFLKYKETKDIQGIALDSNDEIGQMAQDLNLEMDEAKAVLKQDIQLIESATDMVKEIKNASYEK